MFLALGICAILYVLFFSGTVSQKQTVKDAALAESFLKYDIITHENMSLGDTVRTFSGKDKAWSALVASQMSRFLGGNPTVTKLASPFSVFSYRLSYLDGHTAWIVWYDDGTGVAPTTDITVTFPVGETPHNVVMTERLLQPSESEPLTRGYLIEEGIANVTIASVPIFVYQQ